MKQEVAKNRLGPIVSGHNKKSSRPRATAARRPTRNSNVAVDVACADLLDTLAAAIVPLGISCNEFESAARRAFVRAASGIARLRNGKPNQSRVSVLTGLSRAEVKRSGPIGAARCAAPIVGHSKIATIVAGWNHDVRFTVAGRHARALALKPADAMGFETLVQDYAGDVTPKAVLAEMLRLNLVSLRRNGSVVLLRAAAGSKRAITTLKMADLAMRAQSTVEDRYHWNASHRISFQVQDAALFASAARELREQITAFAAALGARQAEFSQRGQQRLKIEIAVLAAAAPRDKVGSKQA